MSDYEIFLISTCVAAVAAGTATAALTRDLLASSSVAVAVAFFLFAVMFSMRMPPP